MADHDKAIARRIKQHVIAAKHRFFAVVQPGFESIAAEELREIGIDGITETAEGGMEFESRLEGCCRVNLCAHAITRVLMRLADFRATHFTRLRHKVQMLPWELFVKEGTVLRFSVTSRHSRLYHTGRIGEEFSGGISARLKEYGIEVQFGDEGNLPEQQVFIRFENDICTVSLDSSGEPLYRRGYKTRTTQAPLRETLASAILKAARLEKYDILMDPMCGSGSFSTEAAQIFLHRCPGINRDFTFRLWPAFHEAAFNHLIKKLISEQLPPATLHEKQILCSDIDEKAIAAARINIANAGFQDFIAMRRADFLKESLPVPDGKKALIVLNPPYGARLGDRQSSERLYRGIGRKIRSDYPGCGYAIIVPGIDMEKTLSLTYDRKILFIHGGIKVAIIIRDGY